MATLNFDGLKETFDRDGFVIIRGYLSPEELTQMRGQLSSYRHHVDGWQADFGKGGAVKGMDHHDDWYRNYLLAGRHIPLMKYLVEDDLAPDNVTWIDKPEGVPRTFPHYDAIGSYRTPPSGASIWIALDKIDLDNGCLHYEKGSHRREKPKSYPLPDYDERNPMAVPVEAEPGDAVIHSALTVHWSVDPKESRPRNAMVFVYWGASSSIDPIAMKRSRTGYAHAGVTV